MTTDQQLRDQLSNMLRGGHAHATFDQSVKDFNARLAGTRAPGLPHSPWELLEHLRITQNDILRFSRSSDYKELKWPQEYWPSPDSAPTERDWETSVQLFRDDLHGFISLVQDQSRDLYEPFPWGDGQTLLREAILLIDHNSYHLGQLVLVRRALGEWKG